MMQVAHFNLSERYTYDEDEVQVELITTVSDQEGNEIELTWLNADQFSTEKAQQLESKFMEIMDIIGSDIERFSN
jgi:hypothetical protein